MHLGLSLSLTAALGCHHSIGGAHRFCPHDDICRETKIGTKALPRHHQQQQEQIYSYDCNHYHFYHNYCHN